MEIQNDILSDEWINNFEKNDKLYQDFYKEDIYYINIHFIYVNTNNEIEKIKEENFLMSDPNFVSRDQLLGLIKRNNIENKRKYDLLSILKFNILLNPEDILFFLKNNSYNNNESLKLIKNIDSIKFEKTINMFQDLNDLIIIFYEHDYKTHSVSHSSTKRVYLNNSSSLRKKTIKKQYKG